MLRTGKKDLPNLTGAHGQILEALIRVASFVLLGRAAAATKEIAVAYRYGLSEELDAYLFVFNLVTWPVAVWFSVLTVVLVPLEARVRQQSPADLPYFRSQLLGLALIVAAILSIVCWGG